MTPPALVDAVVRDALAAALPSMHPTVVERVRELEASLLKLPQLAFVTRHLIHAGVYARTVSLPKGAVITGVLVKRATVLIVNGDVSVYTGEQGAMRATGYHVIPAFAHRKQAFYAHVDTTLTMLFPTAARTVAEAEAEFTDETDMLVSRMGENVVHITEVEA